MKTVLVTGGAGFVGSSLAIQLKQRHDVRVIALDNLKRRGAELNVPRLRGAGVDFVHGDTRQPADVDVGAPDCIIDCAAEPSVLAGYQTSPGYVVGTNLIGTFNTLEVARRHGADLVFLSTSRVYPYTAINALNYIETDTRFALARDQAVTGVSEAGFTETFPMDGLRSLYGATKLASELLVAEYLAMYSLRGVINRCGVIAGPWQMGKVDQGFVTHWLVRHLLGGHLAYKGFGGGGKQVRDVLHVDDLSQLIDCQLEQLDTLSGRTFNVGGGAPRSVSLCELTEICTRVTGRRLQLGSAEATSPADVCLYISDSHAVTRATGWEPTRTVDVIVDDTLAWVTDNRQMLEPIFTA